MRCHEFTNALGRFVEHRNPRTFGDEAINDGAAKARTTAGDQYNLSIKPAHVLSLPPEMFCCTPPKRACCAHQRRVTWAQP